MSSVSAPTNAAVQMGPNNEMNPYNPVTYVALAVASVGGVALAAQKIHRSLHSPYHPSRTINLITAAGPYILIFAFGLFMIGLFCCRNSEERESFPPLLWQVEPLSIGTRPQEQTV